MTDPADLLAQIIVLPQDDHLRRVCADRVQEDGQDERAEFIRLQLARTGLPHVPPVPPGEAAAADARIDVLLAVHGREWVGCDLFPIAAGRTRPAERPGDHAAFARGFVEEVQRGYAVWLVHAPVLIARHPIRTVHLTTPPDYTVQDLEGRRVVSLGGTGVRREVDADFHPHTIRLLLLREAWPGVTFRLPT